MEDNTREWWDIQNTSEDEKRLDKWWVSLSIAQKERIATKANKDGYTITYPACSEWWRGAVLELKQKIHDHCVDKHGYLLPEFTDKVNATMSY